MATVSLQGLHKSFGSTEVIKNVNVEVEDREFVALVGPSGCGKSTTLRILGGFEKPDSGSVILNGKNVTHLPPEKREVNMVFQEINGLIT